MTLVGAIACKAKLSLSNAARLSFSDLCILLLLFLSLCRLCVCVFLCSHWSLVDVPLIFFCPADHVPDWQPRVLLGMVEARSVNVKKTTTKCRITCLRVTLRELENFCITFDDFVGWAANQTVFSIACNSDSEILTALQTVCVVCVFFPSILDISSLDVPAGVTQEEGHTGFLIHLLSAVRALIFLARKIQPFLSLVDREVEFCVLTFNRSPPVGHFFFFFLVRKIPFVGIELTS